MVDVDRWKGDMMRPFTLRVALGGGLFAFGAQLGAQAPTVISLKPATSTLAQEFTSIRSVRELADGRLLISEDVVSVADFRDNSVRQVGRKGGGPGEYMSTSYLFAVRGDTTYMTSGQRWTVFAGDRIVSTLAPDDRLVGATRVGILNGTANATSLVMMQHAGRAGGNSGAPLDSPYVVRVNRTTFASDTVTRVRPIPQGVPMGTMKDGRGNLVPVYRISGYAVMEDAMPFDDGWVAVVRLSPYRVDWFAPDGKAVRGSALASQTLFTRREHEARAQRSARRTGKPPYKVNDADVDETQTIPEIGELRSLFAAPDGRLAVKRTQTASFEMTRYDLVDRQGKVSVQLRMPETERIVGFGKRSVYVAARDDDGIEHLRKHPWP
jgi:hypothetical protein